MIITNALKTMGIRICIINKVNFNKNSLSLPYLPANDKRQCC